MTPLNVLFRKEPKQDAPSIFFFRKKETKNKPLSRPSDIYTPYGRNLYEPKYNSSEFFDFVKNRLADYSSFLTEELNSD
jgi:hypothetical protein